MATVTSLGFTITSRWNGDGVRRARRDLRSLNDDFDKNNVRISRLTGSIFNLQTALVSLGPALLPIGTVATGVVGGLTAIGVAAGSAFGIYGAAVQGAIKPTLDISKKYAENKQRIDALTAAHKKLPPTLQAIVDKYNAMSGPQKQFINSTNQLSFAWHKFIDASSPMTLSAASVATQGLTAGVGKLLPVVRAVHPIVMGIASDFRRWASGSGMDRFIQLVIQYGVPGLRNFVAAGKSVISVLGTGFRAFLPLGLQISDAIKQGALHLQMWANNGGFQTFLARVKAEGPGVREFFKALGAASSNLFTVLRNLGPTSLGLATALLKIVAACPPSVITAMAYAFTAMKIAMTGLLVVRMVTQGIMMLRIAWATLNLVWVASPIGLILTGIALLIGAIVLIATKTRWFQTIWHYVWAGVRAFGLAVWGGLRTAGLAIWHGMQAGWGAVCNFFSSKWRSIWSGIRNFGHAVWSGMRAALSGYMNIYRSLWTGGWNRIASFTSGLFGRIRSWASGFWGFLKRGFSGTVSAIGSAWNRLRGVMAAPVRFVVNTVIGGLSRAWNGIVGHVGLGKLKLPVPHVNFADGGMVGRKNFASGGKVNGPGGPRSDKIPANLSAGEYVIPAHVVKKYGAGYFDSLIGHGGAAYKGIKGAFNGKNVVNAFDIPNPFKAIGKAASAVGGFVKNIGGSIKDWILGLLERGAVEKLLLGPVNALMGKMPGTGVVAQLLKGIVPKLVKGAIDLLMKKNDAALGSVGGKIPAGNHKAIIAAAMKMAHVPPPGSAAQWMAGLNTLITRESGWNAGAVNNWDINAKNGNASRGLAQVIPTTFNAYAPAAARRLGIMNPVANVAAAIRYIVARYGNISRVQQANANMPPKGYAMGGLVANSFDRGGYLPKGLSLAYNGTGRPEPVGHGLGGVSIEFNNCTFSGGRQDFEDMVVEAYSNARRKKRVP